MCLGSASVAGPQSMLHELLLSCLLLICLLNSGFKHNRPVAIARFTSYMFKKRNTENNDFGCKKLFSNKEQESMLPVSLSEERQNGGFA